MNMNPYFFSKMVVAFLYLGPPDLLLAEPRPAEIFMNRNYMAELRRRAKLIGDVLLTSQTDPDQISDDNFSPFLYPPFFNGLEAPVIIQELPPGSSDAVGTIISDRPPHRTVRALLRIRLPPWMSGEEARCTIRMQNAWGWNPSLEDPGYAVPRRPSSLTATA